MKMESLSLHQALQVKGRVEADSNFNSVQIYTAYDKYEKELNELYHKLCKFDSHEVSDYVRKIMYNNENEMLFEFIKTIVMMYRENLI